MTARPPPFIYAPTLRPAGFATVPAGFTEFGPPTDDYPHGTVSYARPLRSEDVEHFDLEPLDPDDPMIWKRAFQTYRDEVYRTFSETDGFEQPHDAGGRYTLSYSTRPNVTFQVTTWQEDWTPTGHFDVDDFGEAAKLLWGAVPRDERQRRLEAALWKRRAREKNPIVRDGDQWWSTDTWRDFGASIKDRREVADMLAEQVLASDMAADDLEDATETLYAQMDERVLYLAILEIAPDRRGRGLAGKTLLRVLDDARAMGVRQAWGFACHDEWKDPRTPTRIWGALGFVVVNRSPWGCSVMARPTDVTEEERRKYGSRKPRRLPNPATENSDRRPNPKRRPPPPLQLTATQEPWSSQTRLSFKSRGASGRVDLTYGPAPAVADWAWDNAGYSRGEKFGEASDVVAFIRWVSVTPAERGWGTRLLNAVLDWLRGRGVMRVYLNPVADDDDAQDRLIAFYERAGFEEIEREEIYGDTSVVLMEALL